MGEACEEVHVVRYSVVEANRFLPPPGGIRVGGREIQAALVEPRRRQGIEGVEQNPRIRIDLGGGDHVIGKRYTRVGVTDDPRVRPLQQGTEVSNALCGCRDNSGARPAALDDAPPFL